MSIYVTQYGDKIAAENAKELVRQMAATSFCDNDESLHQFMRDVAGRSEVAAGVSLRHDSCDNFVTDMLLHGLLKVEQ